MLNWCKEVLVIKKVKNNEKDTVGTFFGITVTKDKSNRIQN